MGQAKFSFKEKQTQFVGRYKSYGYNEKNNLSKRSIADCLQTRPVDYRARLKRIRGTLEPEILEKIDQALKIVFGL